MNTIPSLRRTFALAITSVALTTLLSGCSNFAATDLTIATGNTTISGHLHGGNQPVGGATVKLYAVGTTGYGSAPTLYATTTTASDGGGSFSFSRTGTGNSTPTTNVYGCPSGSNPQMYLTATGGSTQGVGNGTNAAAAFIIAIGPCKSQFSGFLDLNEVTTVATLAALQQYFSPANANSATDGLNHLGYPNTTQAALGYANGAATIGILANISSGVASGATTISGTSTLSGVSVTALPETAKINTLANILALCINTTNSTSSGCNTLFTNAVPPSPAVTSQPSLTFGTATDTLQALYYLLTNPTSGSATAINNLFTAQASAAPFQPNLAAAPTDWTIAIGYTSSSACSTGTFLLAPYNIAADANGNIWTSGTSASGNLMEISPNGTPLTCALGTNLATSKGITIDTAGNIWATSAVANAPVYEYTPGTTPVSTAWAIPSTAVANAIVADGSGNVFFTDSVLKVLHEFAGASTASAASAAINVGGTTGSSPVFAAVDTTGRVFVDNATTTTSIYDFYPSTATGNTNNYQSASLTSATNVYNNFGLAAGLGGVIYGANSSNSTSLIAQTAYTLTPSTITPGTGTYSTNTAQYAGGLAGVRGSAIDGAGNVWYADSLAPPFNYVTGLTNTLLYYSVSEFSSANAPLSPSGTISSGTTGSNGGFQKDPTIFTSAPHGVAVDPTGNVWFGSNSTTGNGIVELVGAGVPVVTPISAALAAGITSGNAVSKP